MCISNKIFSLTRGVIKYRWSCIIAVNQLLVLFTLTVPFFKTMMYFFTETSLASQSMYRAVKEAYEPEWVGYTELTAAVEVLVMELCDFVVLYVGNY